MWVIFVQAWVRELDRVGRGPALTPGQAAAERRHLDRLGLAMAAGAVVPGLVVLGGWLLGW